MEVERYFCYLPKWKIVVCKSCKRGIWPSWIGRHLAGMPHKLAKYKRLAIQEKVENMDVLKDEREWIKVEGLAKEIEELEVAKVGFRCVVNGCGYCCLKISALEQHWSRDHKGLKNKPGNKTKATLVEMEERKKSWYEKVMMQRFFENGRGSNYFKIAQEEEEDVEEISEPNKRALLLLFTKEKDNLVKEKKKHIEDNEGGMENNPWLDTMRWKDYLGGGTMERGYLLSLVQEPEVEQSRDRTEKLVQVIWKAMDGLVVLGQDVVNNSGDFVRLELMRTERHMDNRIRKLSGYMNRKDVLEYALPWKKIVAFFVRTRLVESLEKKPKYEFKDKEVMWFENMMAEAEDRLANPWVEQLDLEDEDGRKKMKVVGLEFACLKFCMALMERKCLNNEYSLPFVCALAVLGVQDDGWVGPERFGSLLSQILKVARFWVLLDCMQSEEIVDEGEDESEPVDLLGMIQARVDELLTRGCQRAMQWVIEKRAYAMKVNYEQNSEGEVEWSGDVLRIKGLEFSMDDLRGMVLGLIEEAGKGLREVVLGSGPGDLPEIPWDKLRDDSSRNGLGFNFVKYERNQWPVDGETWLIGKLVEEGRLGQGYAWDMKKLAEWLKQVVRVKEWLLLLIHLTGGAPARGPEILGTRHTSTGMVEGRNLFMEDGAVVSVLRYHKGYAVSGEVKVIHRYLPREVGSLVVWYLWLVWPCAEVLERAWRSRDEHAGRGSGWLGSCLMWGEDYDGTGWDSARMSKLLKRVTQDKLRGSGIGIALWRHAAVAIGRRYLKTGRWTDLDEDADEEESDAVDLQAAHDTRTADLVYGRLVSERSGEWESLRAKFRVASEDWHRFLRLGEPRHGGYLRGTKRVQLKEEELALEVQEERFLRWKRMKRVNLDEQLVQMMGEGVQFRGEQRAVLSAVMDGAERVICVMGTGSGKSLLFMLPGFVAGGGMTVVVVPLLALMGDLVHRCQQYGIHAEEWDWKRPPFGARVVFATPEVALGERFCRFLSAVQREGGLDRVVVDECHVVLNDDKDFRPLLKELGQLNRWKVQMVMLTATLPPGLEAKFLERMKLARPEVRLFRMQTARANLAYQVYELPKKASREERQEEVHELILRKQAWIQGQGGGKMVIYCGSIREVQEWAETLGCEAYYHHAVNKEAILGRFLEPNEPGEVVVLVASSAFGMGVDVKNIRVVLHLYEPGSMLEYGQESGRAGRDGHRSEVVIVKGLGGGLWRAGYGHAEMEQWLAGKLCKRVILDQYMDGTEGRGPCGENEQGCDVCVQAGHLVAKMGGQGDGLGVESRLAVAVGFQEQQERMAFESRQRIQEQIWHRIKVNERKEHEMMAQLRTWIGKLIGRCLVCAEFTKREPAGDQQHGIADCPLLEDRVCEELQKHWPYWRQIMKQKRNLEEFGGCWECLLPFGWCDKWEERLSERKRDVNAGGGLWQVKNGHGGPCGLAGVMVLMFAMILTWGEGLQARVACREQEMGNQRVKYLGQKIQMGGIDCFAIVKEVLMWLKDYPEQQQRVLRTWLTL